MENSRIKNYIFSALDIKPGEGVLVGLMFLYNFILLVTLYLLKPVRDSLFLVEMGAQQLPYVFILTALVAVPVSMGYSRYSSKVSLGWVINGVTLFLSASLVLIWWLLRIESPILYYALYIWVSIYSILITSQFWLLANDLFRPTQAKRIFALLSLGAIAGSIAGGEITGLLTDNFGLSPASLLLMGAGILFLTVFLVGAIRQVANGAEGTRQIFKKQDIEDRKGDELGSTLFKDILQSRHLLLIIGIIAISVITTTIIDYQFKTIASSVYLTDSTLTTFMGRFYGRINIVAFLLQLFLASKFIERRGVGGAVAILPSILLVGSISLFVWPGLIAAVLLRGADQSLKHSVDRTGRELLFVPVELKLKKRTKVFIDLFVDNGAQGLAGGLLLLLTFVFSISVPYLSLIVIGLLFIWIMLVIWVRRSYINQFRLSLEEQVNDEGSEQEVIDAELTLPKMLDNLQSRDNSTVLQSLKVLGEDYDLREIPIHVLEKLLGHPNPPVRKRTLKLFRTRNIDGYLQEVARLLEDPNAEVRLEAARYIYHFYEVDAYEVDWISLFKEGLNHRDVKIRAATLGLIAKDGGEQEYALISDELLEKALSFKGEGAKELRVEAARALGVAYNQSRAHFLQQLLEDRFPEVVKEAIYSAGKTGDRKFVPLLIDYLDTRRFKKSAQWGLSRYGRRILGTLLDYLVDEQGELSRQLQIPHILYLNQTQVALEVLQVGLDESNVPVRHQIIKALNKIRQKVTSPAFNKEKLKENVYLEARRYALLNQSLSVINLSHHPTLCELVGEEISKSFENVFRLLGLVYDADDIYNVYKGIKSGEEALVSESIEFLDNLMEWEIRKDLMPLFESELTEEQEYGDFEDMIQSKQEAIHFLASLSHPVLQSQLQQTGAIEGMSTRSKTDEPL